ncbi:MAG: hypothetical protein IIW54_12035 [Lachnospiraceae bacterium]|nr:hypothetical protein [Lachnospiraceae bacterium]
MEKLKKHQTIPFVDVGTSDTQDWARIGYSTIFDLVLNANTVTNDYIKDEMPTDEVTHYKPSLSQELQTIKGDPAFDFLYDMLYNLPTGEAIKRDVLLVFAGNIGTEDTPKFNAWKVKASIILTNFNTVDEKILFDLSLGGSIVKGTATVTDGKPVFQSAA